MAVARRVAVKESAPWFTKWSVHSFRRSVVSTLHAFTWPASGGLVLLAPSGEESRGQGDARTAPDVAHDVVGRGGVAQALDADGGQGQRLQWHEDEAHGEAMEEAREGEAPVVHAEGQIRHEGEGDGVEQAAPRSA